MSEAVFGSADDEVANEVVEVPKDIDRAAIALASLKRSGHGIAYADDEPSGAGPFGLSASAPAGGAPVFNEGSIGEGLNWLTRRQLASGGWSLKYPFKDGAITEDAPAAATGLALLAFAGAGVTGRSEMFGEPFGRGIERLLEYQRPDGSFMGPRKGSYALLYTQAICCMAACRIYDLTHEGRIRDCAQRAVDFCIVSQHKEKGGWRYGKAVDSDTSVTGWVVLALRSASSLGLSVPSQAYERASSYYEQVRKTDGAYGYLPRDEPTASMTAESLLAMCCLGWSPRDSRVIGGADRLILGSPPHARRDAYYWYFGTQLFFNIGGHRWEQWGSKMRAMLVSQQELTGAERGSWDAFRPSQDAWAGAGGRLYTTCLSLCILEMCSSTSGVAKQASDLTSGFELNGR